MKSVFSIQCSVFSMLCSVFGRWRSAGTGRRAWGRTFEPRRHIACSVFGVHCRGFFCFAFLLLNTAAMAAVLATIIAAQPVSAQQARMPLPRALIIGDSITMGYSVCLPPLLKGKVEFSACNAFTSADGASNLVARLGDAKWDGIVFNHGLHDMKLVPDGQGQTRQQVPLPEYESIMDELVRRMKETGARVMFVTTTPVPDGTFSRLPEDVPLYNAAARRVMEKNNVEIIELYGFAVPQLEKIQLRNNVHFTNDGSKILAEYVAERIMKLLSAPEH